MTNEPISLLFFGSFQDYSALVLKGLLSDARIKVVGIVTTPPYSPNSKSLPIPNLVQVVGEQNGIPVFVPTNLNEQSLRDIVAVTGSVEVFLTVGYGKMIPDGWLKAPKLAALNLHFSLLPSYRGANPVEYALMFGENQIGITLMEMDEEFDTGPICSQVGMDIEPVDTRISLYEKLYQLGGECIATMLGEYVSMKRIGNNPSLPQPDESPTPMAYMLKKNDGYITWNAVQKMMKGEEIEFHELPKIFKVVQQWQAQNDRKPFSVLKLCVRATRALMGYPTFWTMIPTSKGRKRMVIHSIKPDNYLVLNQVQIEGQAKSQFNQVKNVISW